MRLPRRRAAAAARSRWSSTTAATGWGESTFAEQAWDQSRSAALRWALAGASAGALIGMVAFAPATWLARAVADASGQRVLLADARGTVWSGSAVAVLTGGAGSRDASALPGRLGWTIGLNGPGRGGLGLLVEATQPCCLNGTLAVVVRPGFGRVVATLLPPATASGAPGWIGQWPAAWLSGLGTPWNTLQPGGALRLSSNGLTLESAQGRWRVDGRADVDLVGASSRMSSIAPLGSYRFSLTGDPGNAGITTLNLLTLDGALQLGGSGTWASGGVRFRGEARAAPGSEAALSNILNIIGRREGARSVISIG